MSFQIEASKYLFKHVFKNSKLSKSWRILVLDKFAADILTYCVNIQDVMNTGIALVENLFDNRETLPMEAIYLIYPNDQSINILVQDFKSKLPKYFAAYVFLLIGCQDELLHYIAASGCLKYFKVLTQLNLGFVSIESHVYSLNNSETWCLYSSSVNKMLIKNTYLDRLAEQLTTICILLNEFPCIRFRKNIINQEFASLVQKKLIQYREDNPSFGQGLHKNMSILLILDRGIDPLTPVLHDLTLQALAYDIFDIRDNIYRYADNRKFQLNDRDKLWNDLRHEHIADASKSLPIKVRQFYESKRHLLSSKPPPKGAGQDENLSSEGGVVNEGADFEGDGCKPRDTNLRTLRTMLQELPQFQKEAASYDALVSLADSCLAICKGGLNKICGLEQDLVMGQTSEGDQLSDPTRSLVSVLQPDVMTESERFRLLLIFILSRGGISEEHLDRLLEYAKLPLNYKECFDACSAIIGACIINLKGSASKSFLIKDFADLSNSSTVYQNYLPSKGKRVDRVDENCYALSRWSPYLLDLMEQCIGNGLDAVTYPMLPVPAAVSRGLTVSNAGLLETDSSARGPSARYRPSSPSRSQQTHHDLIGSDDAWKANSEEDKASMNNHIGPRLIVFLLGGVTWSEVRAAYSVTQRCIETRLMASDKPTKTNSRRRGNTKHTKDGGGVGWNWEVIIGGTHMINAEAFVQDLKAISRSK